MTALSDPCATGRCNDCRGDACLPVAEIVACECECHPEPEACAFVVHYGSRNPDSPSFGPHERCEGYATPWSEYCEAHGGGDEQ